MVSGRASALLGAVVAVATALALAPGASGHDAGFKTKVTIHNVDNSAYRGKVRSKAPSCVRGRTVTLFQNDPGPDQAIGEDTTDSEGRWVVGLPAPGSDYYAKAKRRVISRPGHRHVCRGGRSPDSTYRAPASRGSQARLQANDV